MGLELIDCSVSLITEIMVPKFQHLDNKYILNTVSSNKVQPDKLLLNLGIQCESFVETSFSRCVVLLFNTA